MRAMRCPWRGLLDRNGTAHQGKSEDKLLAQCGVDWMMLPGSREQGTARGGPPQIMQGVRSRRGTGRTCHP
eukprot:7639090-Pyramimonas_sp.AAC.1